MEVNATTPILEKLPQIRFGILKTVSTFFPSTRCLIEAEEFDEQGLLLCTTMEKFGKSKVIKPIKVSIRFVNKEEDMFILATGRCVIESIQDGKTTLKIQIEEAKWFQKKSLSKYTSVLQNIYTYTLGKLVPGSRFTERKVA